MHLDHFAKKITARTKGRVGFLNGADARYKASVKAYESQQKALRDKEKRQKPGVDRAGDEKVAQANAGKPDRVAGAAEGVRGVVRVPGVQ